HRQKNARRFLQRDAPALHEQRGEIFSLQQVHYQKRHMFTKANIDNVDDVGMTDLRGMLCLTQESRSRPRIVGARQPQRLYPYPLPQEDMLRLIEHTHPARGELPHHDVLAESRSGSEVYFLVQPTHFPSLCTAPVRAAAQGGPHDNRPRANREASPKPMTQPL